MKARIDAYCSEPHFVDHVVPIWNELPAKLRGKFLVDPEVSGHARSRGVTVQEISPEDLEATSGFVIVASIRDLNRTGDRPAVFVEHGAGQTYTIPSPSYSGGVGREAVALFLVPNEVVAERTRKAYRRAGVRVVGCPKLDRWFPIPDPRDEEPEIGKPTVAISFHWNCRIQPEARSALPYYKAAVGALAKQHQVIGHGHPRAFLESPVLERIYRRAGIEIVRDLDDVLARADLLVCDNSSALYEFAALGKPVVVMNAPWYRERVQHGLRFWEYADVGVQVWRPMGLVNAVNEALVDTPRRKARRKEISEAIYGPLDGKAADRAASAIADLLEAS